MSPKVTWYCWAPIGIDKEIAFLTRSYLQMLLRLWEVTAKWNAPTMSEIKKKKTQIKPIANYIFHSIMNAKKKGLGDENSSHRTMALACAVVCWPKMKRKPSDKTLSAIFQFAPFWIDKCRGKTKEDNLHIDEVFTHLCTGGGLDPVSSINICISLFTSIQVWPSCFFTPSSFLCHSTFSQRHMLLTAT